MAEDSKQKHILIIETPRTGTGLKIIETALALRYQVSFITEDVEKYRIAYGLDNALIHLGNRIHTVASVADLPSVVQLARALHAKEPIDAVFSLIDRSIEAAAAVSEALSLKHLSLESARNCLQKDRMRAICQEAGIRIPRFRVVTSEGELSKIAEEWKFPFILKSSRGMGSMEVRLVRHESEMGSMFRLIKKLADANRGNVLAEELLKGPLFSAESLTVDGRTKILGYSNRIMGKVPSFVEVCVGFPAILSPNFSKECEDLIQNTLRALRFNHGACHTEFILTEKGPAIVEVNPRLAGGYSSWAISESYGASIFEELFRMSLGQKSQWPEVPLFGCVDYWIYSPISGTLKEIRGVNLVRTFPGVEKLEIAAKVGDLIQPPVDWKGYLGVLLIKSGNAALAESCAHAALSYLEFVVE